MRPLVGCYGNESGCSPGNRLTKGTQGRDHPYVGRSHTSLLDHDGSRPLGLVPSTGLAAGLLEVKPAWGVPLSKRLLRLHILCLPNEELWF